MGDDAAFWDKIAEEYAASPVKDVASYERTLERTRAHLSPSDEILEVGCGTGSTALRLASDVAHVTATDGSNAMLEIARGKAHEQGVGNVRFAQSMLPDPALEERTYDAVLAFNTLHLVSDLPAVLRNLANALEPGGLLITKTVCLAEQTRLWAIPLFVLRLLGKAPSVHLLSFDALETAICDAGFEIVEMGDHPAPRNRFVVARKKPTP
ncbi:MAG: class I SAM-dependent methyltransferase [Myxococcota bacterium]|nr:class I SAM-dependent methyltransferase [Myxococcota bacterium]